MSLRFDAMYIGARGISQEYYIIRSEELNNQPTLTR